MSKRGVKQQPEDTVFTVEQQEPVAIPQRLAYRLVAGSLRFDKRTREWFKYRTQTQLLFATASDADLRQAAEHIFTDYLGDPAGSTGIAPLTEKLKGIRSHVLETGLNQRYLEKGTDCV